MAAINDLVAQITDEELRTRIEAELKRVMKHKKFGLVFEDHLPEGLNNGPIYPGLDVVDSVHHAPDDKLWHALIEADNYYALQLLAYLYPGQVDCIYIDPPYNTGARDWKYNNDYVDSADTYRHSKWLSMMKRRLLLAKRLLNPKDSVLIVTIDEKEYLHLGCLLEEMFPEAAMTMATDIINPRAGVARKGTFRRSQEYVYIIQFGNSEVVPDIIEDPESKQNPIWFSLMRTGSNSARKERPNLFYPIWVYPDGKLYSVGENISIDVDRLSITAPAENVIAIFPLRPDGREQCWQLGRETLSKAFEEGTAKINSYKGKFSVAYLRNAEKQRIENGEIKVIGRDENGALMLEHNKEIGKTKAPDSVWNKPSHDAGIYGSSLISAIFQDRRFSFPKSLYAEYDALRFFVANKPNAIIVDFFAGSGTTLHAVNLLNAEDGGHRRCIMVTNNEVSVEEAKSLKAQGYKPGDAEWERLGIAQYVNWPRTVCSIKGTDVNGQPLKGEYLGTDHRQMSEGFESNCIFFRLNFLDKGNVKLGNQFRELLPLLWMKSGAVGTCPTLDGEDVPDMLILPNNEFAVLNNEKAFGDFFQQLMENESIRMVYLIVDSDAMYREMAKVLTTGTFASRHIKTCQLYRDYLDNFRINIPR